MIVGNFTTRLAETAGDITAAQKLRYRAFCPAGTDDYGRDADEFDAICHHFLVEDRTTQQLVATFRLLPFNSGAEIAQSYSAQFYDLEALGRFEKPMVEMGRFCIEPGVSHPDILRAAWGAVTQYVDREGVELLFGCSSFKGTNTKAYTDAFAVLRDRHIAPKRWLPQIKAPSIFRFAQRLRREPDRKRAMKTMPPLLRSYLSMGGWVSDHAVVDRELDTLHVFTGLEISAIPKGRARVLRAVAG